MRALSIISIGLIGLSISTTTLSGEYTDQVKAQLQLFKLAASVDGWEETHNDKFDKLDKGDSDSFGFTLHKGTSYKIISACDENCSDLDVVLYDENDNPVSKDSGTDSIPMVEATPKWTGEFRLKVKMHSCSSNPCYYGISIFGK